MARLNVTTYPWDKSQVGRRLEALREAKGWGQTYLATILGPPATPQKINNYESGRDLLPTDMAGRICGIVGSGVDFNYLFGGQMGNISEKLAERIAEELNKPPRRPARRG